MRSVVVFAWFVWLFVCLRVVCVFGNTRPFLTILRSSILQQQRKQAAVSEFLFTPLEWCEAVDKNACGQFVFASRRVVWLFVWCVCVCLANHVLF